MKVLISGESGFCSLVALSDSVLLAKVHTPLDGEITEFYILVVAVLGAHDALKEWRSDVPLLEMAKVFAALRMP
jgi:hypothetical protein